MHLLENNITKFSTIATIDNIKDLFSLPLSSIGYVNLPFFTASGGLLDLLLRAAVGKNRIFFIGAGLFILREVESISFLYDNDHTQHCLKHLN